ncbi:hypothetical protein BXY66_0481 [Shimia isoporae]|uniref:Damage-inducible protein DinB n=1 Tax=Shimia isoporae TaxID=647720 RepID=A0A4R1NJS0_9RHOB|nr:DUF1993 family protein [Shimia isoporae]TCL08444.1 hypothetical protein BXY66_0481 [Shimia isoporae]
MTDAVLFAYVPVFRHYLGRIAGLSERANTDQLESRLSPDGFDALTHFAIAQGYVLRALLPVLGRDVPKMPDVADADGLKARGALVGETLDAMTAVEFDGAVKRSVTHVAGEAELTQSAFDFLTLYAAPNFFFHMGQGYAILRAQGADVGKGDFDGFHSYPKGFSFVTGAAETVQQ